MECFLHKLFYMSLTASYLVMIVILIRFLLVKAPKWIRVLLWSMVGVRLLVPLRVESIFSLIPRAMTQQVAKQFSMPTNEINVTSETVTLHLAELDTSIDFVASSMEPIQQSSEISWSFVFFVIWMIGFFGMFLYCIVGYRRLSVRMREAVKYVGKGNDIYQSDQLDSPFVLGIFKPRIYLPFSLTKQEMEFVIAHERAHIKRKDHWVKTFAFFLLAIHWFNPFIWIAYILLSRDIELACDEKVISILGEEHKKVYSQTLLKCSVYRCSIAACPLGFGETGVKGRIKNVLYYKKPSFGVVIGSVLICIVVAVCFLTNPHKEVMEKLVMEEQVKEDVEHKKLLDLADVYAELMNEVAKEGDCFATSDVTVEDTVVKEECVVFDAVIKEIMVDTKDCICITSKSDDYPGAFILVIPENDMNRNHFSGGSMITVTARETGETQSHMKVLEAIEIYLDDSND